MSNQFFGKYRGTVSDIQDPLMIGRIRARVPDVMGDQESGWAMPCAPFGGSGMGFSRCRKSVRASGSNLSTAIPIIRSGPVAGSGSAAEIPPDLLTPPYKKVMLKTEGGHSIVLDDTPGIGGITLQTSGGQKIVMNATGIEIDNGMGGKIKMTGPQVSVNDGALDVI